MVYRAIGLMSGSSLDGLDIAFVEFQEQGGHWTYEILEAGCSPYTDEWKTRLSGATGLSARDYLLLHAEYGHYTGQQVNAFIETHNLQYKVAVMNGQGLNTKDKNSQKDVVGNLMVNPLKWLSVGGSFIRGTGHAIADSEYTGIKAGENYAKKRWSAGGVVTTSTFNLRTEYLAGKDRSVKSEGFYATGSVRFARNFDFIASFDYFNPNKAADFKQNNYIAGVQYWFYARCRLQAQYTFCNKKGDGQKDSNLIQAQVQVRF